MHGQYLSILVVNLWEPNALERALRGEKVGHTGFGLNLTNCCQLFDTF